MTDNSLFVNTILTIRRYWIIAVLTFFILRSIYRKYFHPLKNIPGPFLAATTNLWRLAIFLRGQQHLEYFNLHQKYGSIVRIGPNTVIFNDPAYLNEYYGFDKSPWWQTFRTNLSESDHGTISNVKEHVIAKRRVMGGYSMTMVLKNESRVDDHVSDLMNQFSKRCGISFDIAPWTQWAAFDIAMDMSFSNPLGFVKSASDVGGLVKSLHDVTTGAGSLALFPSIVALLHSPWIWPFVRPRPTDKIGLGVLFGLASEQVEPRLKAGESKVKNDILQWLVDHEDRGGNRLTKGELEQEAVAPILAGSDTSSSLLRSIILFVCTNQRVLTKLQNLIDTADAAGLLSDPPRYDEIRQHIPFIGAIMREALRMYPTSGVPIYRSVPKDGAFISGYQLPAGTEVGVSQYSFGHSTKIFDEDADIFRPERWIEEVDDSTRRLRESGDVFFGGGPMMCTGRHLATLEILKITTQLFRQFDIQIVNPIRPWQENSNLVLLVWDFQVRMELRKRNFSTEKI